MIKSFWHKGLEFFLSPGTGQVSKRYKRTRFVID